ncbi:MAG TPA: spore coat protein [Desulfobacteria bacterium]|nr:spore coat protein [Desulfobacteria bacterium]
MPMQQSQTRMSEQEIINDLITSEKQTTSSYNTFVSETDCPNLRQTLMSIQQDEQRIHEDLFNAMSQRGWYSVPRAQDQAVQSAKSKFNQIKNQV